MQRRFVAVLFVLAILGAALAGCVTPAGDVAPAADIAPAGSLLAQLQGAPAPALSGEGVIAWIEAFTAAHAPRITGTPGEKAAGDDIRGQLAALGYDATDHKYNARGLPSADGPLRAVVGMKLGTTQPENLIIMGAHYDTSFLLGNPDVPGLPLGLGITLEAAYDNAAGTAVVMELARLLADVPTEKTLVFALFNGEEEGLLASGAYADDLLSQAARIDTYLGFDMVGINWPSTAGCLCIYSGELFAPELNPIQTTVAFDLLGFPNDETSVIIHDNHKTRSSDEASFQGRGYPTMRWAGMASAGNYWGYHKMNDTVDTMVKQAGSRELLQQGFDAAIASAYYTVLGIDMTTLELKRE